jgi:3',5'-cyclic AMP phosphodiesterase CpdA
MKLERIRNVLILALLALPSFTLAQVQSIAPPRNPLPSEATSAAVTKFSFIVYGDTRGRRDGTEVQHEHSLVVDGMLAAIKRLQNTEFPVKFVLQTGDAVVNGGNAQQWNTSFVGLINKLTTEGGVPYFLAPGNHDVTAASSLESRQRQQALQNYLHAMAALIPPDGAQRRLSGYPTYAFGYGNTFFLALDSNIADDETQFNWAASQLKGLDRSRYVNVIAFFHHPIFSSGGHGGSKVEAPTAALRARYMPLFRAHHVRALLTGHEHLFEHWIERYTDESGPHRMDLLVTGGGGAPLNGYQGEPETATYIKANASAKVQVEHLVKPGMRPGDNPYHFVIVRVDGRQMDLEITGIDWGKDFRPYQSNRSELN